MLQKNRNGNRPNLLIALLIVFGLGLGIGAQAEEACPIIPIPDSYQLQNRTVTLPAPEKGAIVTDAKAADPVQFAAERLQTSIVRLTGKKYEILHTVPADTELVVLLGEYGHDDAVTEFCRSERLAVDKLNPERDGFLIGFSGPAQPQVVCVAGSNPRSAIYGQDALTMLLQKINGNYELQAATVQDNADIQWRSFSQNQCDSYLKPGILDAYADARLNCIELRDGPPPMHGHFGYPADWEITGEKEKQVLDEAHRRGMFVYGVVCCGVKPEDFDKVIAQLEKLIALGVDGLYMSYDDPGASDNAPALVARIMEVAKKHNFPDDRIAFLPPAPDYGIVYSDFNCNMVKQVPETADIRWFFTANPSETYDMLTKKAGIRHPRGLFFNWPMGGQLEAMPVCGAWYITVPEFNDSYGWLSFDIFRDADQHIDSVMVWVRNYPEYLGQLIGTWAWNPGKFSYRDARTRIYSRVYGADQVEQARQFDDLLNELKAHMIRLGPFDWQQFAWRLSTVSSRPYARVVLEQMSALQQEIAAKAPAETLLSQERLEKGYLEPMKKVIECSQWLVETDFPEYVNPNFDRDYKWERMHHKSIPYIQYWKGRLEPLLDVIEQRHGDSIVVKQYVDDWRKKLVVPETEAE